MQIMNVFDKSKRHQLIRELTALYDADCHALVQFFGAFYNEVRCNAGRQQLTPRTQRQNA